MNAVNNQLRPINKERLCYIIGYFGISLILLMMIFSILKTYIFYFDVKHENWNFYRFLWCIPFAFLGFSFLALIYIRSPDSPFPKYLIYYPILLFFMCSIVFGVLHLFKSSSSFLYYYLSAPICFTLGYLADDFRSLAKSALNKK